MQAPIRKFSQMFIACLKSKPRGFCHKTSSTDSYKINSPLLNCVSCNGIMRHSTRSIYKAATVSDITSQHLQLRPHKKRIIYYEPLSVPVEEGAYITLAYATAAEYDLEGLKIAMNDQKLYNVAKLPWPDSPDLLHAVASYQLSSEVREIYFFREGAVVFWNCSETEAENVLAILKKFEKGTYDSNDVKAEREMMLYKYQQKGKACQLEEDWGFLLTEVSGDSIGNVLEKFTFSNAMSQSVKLGVWERSLARLADNVQTITKDMAAGNPLKVSRQYAAQLSGQLFDLRHQINLESDLLDTPDFYWEHHDLERLYGKTVAFFSISRRTQVLNKRLEHCVELIELLSTWLSDKQHIRLEWMIIVLIMVEVGFEALHFIERYVI